MVIKPPGSGDPKIPNEPKKPKKRPGALIVEPDHKLRPISPSSTRPPSNLSGRVTGPDSGVAGMSFIHSPIREESEVRRSHLSPVKGPLYSSEAAENFANQVLAKIGSGEYAMKRLDRGTYVIFNAETEKKIAIFKPSDEVRGGQHSRYKKEEASKDGVLPQCEPWNEELVASFFNLPIHASLIEMPGSFYNASVGRDSPCVKQGVLFPFIQGTALTDIHSKNPKDFPQFADALPQEQVEQVMLIDLCLYNADRNLGNFMYDDQTGTLYVIDNATVLPDMGMADVHLAWMDWAQSLLPWSKMSLQELQKRDFEKDKEALLLSFPNYPVGSLQTMEIAYNLVHTFAQAGLPPIAAGILLLGQPSHMLNMMSQAEGNMERIKEKISYLAELLPSRLAEIIVRHPEGEPHRLRHIRKELDDAVSHLLS